MQFESNVAGEVTSVLFYKQSGTTGTMGHVWSSNGTLLASATFTNETSSGWQQVSFSSPVAISANTIYTVSYDTGSPLFYYHSEYFAHGGVTNGNLTAPRSTKINGVVLDNGVYNYGGDFPNSSQYYANFWVDLVFSPTNSPNARTKTAAVVRRRTHQPPWELDRRATPSPRRDRLRPPGRWAPCADRREIVIDVGTATVC